MTFWGRAFFSCLSSPTRASRSSRRRCRCARRACRDVWWLAFLCALQHPSPVGTVPVHTQPGSHSPPHRDSRPQANSFCSMNPMSISLASSEPRTPGACDFYVVADKTEEGCVRWASAAHGSRRPRIFLLLLRFTVSAPPPPLSQRAVPLSPAFHSHRPPPLPSLLTLPHRPVSRILMDFEPSSLSVIHSGVTGSLSAHQLAKRSVQRLLSIPSATNMKRLAGALCEEVRALTGCAGCRGHAPLSLYCKKSTRAGAYAVASLHVSRSVLSRCSSCPHHPPAPSLPINSQSPLHHAPIIQIRSRDGVYVP